MENTIYFDPPTNLDKTLEGLKTQQKEAVLDIIEYLGDKEYKKPYYLLQGSAGTGKTTGVKRTLMHINNHRVIGAAPSHFACNVLRESLDGISVVTVASLLGKVLIGNKNKNKVLEDSGRDKKIHQYDVILVDEISMIKDDIAEEILANSKGKKVIFMGDYFQLTPVNQDTESVLFSNISKELTEPIRFTGPIYDISQAVRGEQLKIKEGYIPNLHVLTDFNNRVSVVDRSGSGYIYFNSINHVLLTFIKKFKESSDPNNVRILAYRHKTINVLNTHIRKILYGANPAQFEQGEVIISNGTFKVFSKEVNKIIGVIRNGEILEIVKTSPIIGPYNIKCIELTFKSRPKLKGVIVVAEEDIIKYKQILKRKEKEAEASPFLWKAYHRFIDTFANFKFAYSTTIHKAQGSSIINVIVMEDDIMEVRPTSYKEKFHALYTAMTRAKFRLYIFNKKSVVDNSQLNIEYLKEKYNG